jgi:hypothetical protein
MTAVLIFAGIVIGVAIAIIGGLVVVHWPEPKREPPRPRVLAVGARSRVVARGSVERFQDGVWP